MAKRKAAAEQLQNGADRNGATRLSASNKISGECWFKIILPEGHDSSLPSFVSMNLNSYIQSNLKDAFSRRPYKGKEVITIGDKAYTSSSIDLKARVLDYDKIKRFLEAFSEENTNFKGYVFVQWPQNIPEPESRPADSALEQKIRDLQEENASLAESNRNLQEKLAGEKSAADELLDEIIKKEEDINNLQSTIQTAQANYSLLYTKYSQLQIFAEQLNAKIERGSEKAELDKFLQEPEQSSKELVKEPGQEVLQAIMPEAAAEMLKSGEDELAMPLELATLNEEYVRLNEGYARLKNEYDMLAAEKTGLAARAINLEAEARSLEQALSTAQKALIAEQEARENDFKVFADCPAQLLGAILTPKGMAVLGERLQGPISEEHMYRLVGGVIEKFIEGAPSDIVSVLISEIKDRYFVDANGKTQNGFKVLQELYVLRRQKSKLEQKLSEQEQKLLQARDTLREYTDLKTQVDDKLAAETMQKQAVSSLTTELEHLQRNYAEIHKQYAEIQQQYAESQQQYAEAQQQLCDLRRSLEEKTSALDSAMSTISSLQELSGKPDLVELSGLSADELLDAYISTQLPLIKTAAQNYEMYRAMTKEDALMNVLQASKSIFEIAEPFAAGLDIGECYSLDELLEKIKMYKKPFEQTEWYDNNVAGYCNAKNALELIRKLEEMLSSIPATIENKTSREALQKTIATCNADEQQACITGFESEKLKYEQEQSKYSQLKSVFEDAADRKKNAEEFLSEIEERIKLGAATVWRIKQSADGENHVIAIKIYADKKTQESALLMDVCECLVDTEAYSELCSGVIAGESSTELRQQEAGLQTMSVPTQQMPEPESIKKENSLEILYRLPNHIFTAKQASELQKKLVEEFEKKYIESKMYSLGFGISIYDLNTALLIQPILQKEIAQQNAVPQQELVQQEYVRKSKTLEDALSTAAQDIITKKPGISGIMSAEELYKIFAKSSIKLDETYRGSEKTAGEIITHVANEAARLKLWIDPSVYNPTKISNAALLWALVEVVVARQGNKFQPIEENMEELRSFFPHGEPKKVKQDIKNAYSQLSERNILEKRIEEYREVMDYRLSNKRRVSEIRVSEIIDSTESDSAPKAAEPVYFDKYHSDLAMEEIIASADESVEKLGLNKHPFAYNSLNAVVNNISYLAIANGCATAKQVKEELKKYFPNITFSEVNEAFRNLEEAGAITANKKIPTSERSRHLYSVSEEFHEKLMQKPQEQK